MPDSKRSVVKVQMLTRNKLVTGFALRFTFALLIASVVVLFSALSIGLLLPERGYLIIWSQRGKTYGVYLMDAQRQLTARVSGLPPDQVLTVPNLSLDARRIVFETLRAGQLEIYAKDVRSGVLYRSPAHAQDRLASWSPDGRYLAFWSDRTRQWNLFIFDTLVNDLRQVTNQLGFIPYGKPKWSPDGRRLALRFWQPGGRDTGTFIMDVSTGEFRGIRSLVDAGADLVWSPDSRHVAFRSDRDRNPEIYVLDVDLQQVVNISNHRAIDFEPDWSPDGTQIVFGSNREGDGEIFIIRGDGSGLYRLTSGGGWRPSWSPDGGQIAFFSNRDGRSALYIIHTDGTGLQRVFYTNDQNVFIRWLGK